MMSADANKSGSHTYEAILDRMSGHMPAPTDPREWDPAGFKRALGQSRGGAGMTMQELLVGLGQWLPVGRVPALSTVYRWADPNSSGPPFFMLPLLCYELGCEVEEITKPITLRRNPFADSEGKRSGAGDGGHKRGTKS